MEKITKKLANNIINSKHKKKHKIILSDIIENNHCNNISCDSINYYSNIRCSLYNYCYGIDKSWSFPIFDLSIPYIAKCTFIEVFGEEELFEVLL